MKPFRIVVLSLLVAGLVPMAASTGSGQPSSQLSEARRLIDKKDFAHALEALGTGSQDAQVLYLKGYVLYRLGRLAEAERELRAALQVDPGSLRSSYILARIAQSHGHPREAIGRLEGPAAAQPQIEDARPRIGKLYWETGQAEKARQWTVKALEDTPWDGSLHYRLGRIYQQGGELGLSKKEFAESLRSKTADSQGVQKLMDCAQALAAHDSTTALRIRSEFLDPAANLDPDLLVALGTAFTSAGAPDQALDLFQLAALRDPGSFQAQFNSGLSLLNLDKASEAMEPLKRSVQLAPESKEANAALALAFVLQGDFQDAIPPLETARLADPNDRKTAGLLSLAYLRSGQAAKAVPILREALKQGSDDPKYYFLLVECLNASEEQQQALSVAELAVKRFPDLAKAWLAEGQQLARLGKYHEAGPLFAKATELAPGQPEPLLGLAEALQKDGDYEGALANYQKVLAEKNDITAVIGAARSLVFLRRVAEARTLLERSETTHATNSQLHSELSRVYARLGARDLAAEQTRIVQQLRAQEDQAGVTAGPR